MKIIMAFLRRLFRHEFNGEFITLNLGIGLARKELQDVVRELHNTLQTRAAGIKGNK